MNKTVAPQAEVRPEVPADGPVLSVRDLVVNYRDKSGGEVTALDGVSLDIHPGETVGLVGESGCGKSTFARTVLNLQPRASGRVEFESTDLSALPAEKLRAIRRRIQIVFQDPKGSLDPRMRLVEIVSEALRLHRTASRKERHRQAEAMMDEVGLDPRLVNRKPGQLSGGQQQRVALARALISRPALVVLDEPVSALDVSVQAQVINLLQELQESHRVAYLFIAHNLAVVRHLSHRVAVMYLGRIVEIGDTEEIFANPRHPYTKALIASVLPPQQSARTQLETARRLSAGEMPSLNAVPSGCAYHTRCPFAVDKCRTERPELKLITGPHAADHQAACHRWETVAAATPEVRAR